MRQGQTPWDSDAGLPRAALRAARGLCRRALARAARAAQALGRALARALGRALWRAAVAALRAVAVGAAVAVAVAVIPAGAPTLTAATWPLWAPLLVWVWLVAPCRAPWISRHGGRGDGPAALLWTYTRATSVPLIAVVVCAGGAYAALYCAPVVALLGWVAARISAAADRALPYDDD